MLNGYPRVLEDSYRQLPTIVSFPFQTVILHVYVSLPEGKSLTIGSCSMAMFNCLGGYMNGVPSNRCYYNIPILMLDYPLFSQLSWSIQFIPRGIIMQNRSDEL